MAGSSDAERLRVAWRALAGEGRGDGWRTISITVGAPCQMLAGRRFPAGEEAILVGFRRPVTGLGQPLPEGRGFRVEIPGGEVLDSSHEWIAFSRHSSGNIEMFVAMAADVVHLLESCERVGDERLCQLFLGRILAWQAFMENESDGVLGPAAEIGLFGELLVLVGLLEAGIPPGTAVGFWQGPLDALQDFLIGFGAIEVKATTAAAGFLATVGSLDQLDDSIRQPLFMVGVRLAVDGEGRTLPELISDVRQRVSEGLGSEAILDSRLLRVGYLEAFANRYARRFSHVQTTVFAVNERFPRLTRAAVPMAIAKVSYVIDLDLVDMPDVGLPGALQQLGQI
jgi:hypothetical protein